MRLLLPILLLVGFLALSFAFERPTERAELTATFTALETLDPQVAQAQEDIRVAYALFEGLLSFEGMTFTVIPGVAERYEVSDDGLVYTFHLRDNARWSDGHPITAEDFIYAWRIGLMPETGVTYITFIQLIKGGEAFTKWGAQTLAEVAAIKDPAARAEAAHQRARDSVAKFQEMVGARALDSRTVQVTLPQRTPYFTEIVACWPLFPLPRHVLEPITTVNTETGVLRRDQQWVKAGRLVNNGSYVLRDWRFKRDVRLKANEHYWNAAEVGPRTVDLIAFADPATMYTGYASGAIDLLMGGQAIPFAAEIVREFKEGKRKDVHQFNSFGCYFFLFNCRPKLADGRPNPLADPRVRKAMSMVVDKKAIVTHVTRLHQSPAGGLTPPGSIAGYPEIAGLSYDVEAGKRLLAEAGYPNGRGMMELEIAFNMGGGHKETSQALQRMWHDRLGLKVELVEQEWKTILERRNTGKYIVARSGWTGDYSDPTTFLSLVRGGDGNNESGIADEKFDAMYKAAEAEPDPKKRLAMLAAAETYMMEEVAPVLPLYYYNIVDLFDPAKLSNVSTHPRDIQLFSQMRVHRK